jgi:formylglycine-generating enzyme required for sulfatase activity
MICQRDRERAEPVEDTHFDHVRKLGLTCGWPDLPGCDRAANRGIITGVKRKVIVTAVAIVLVLTAVVFVGWTLLDLPPPGLVLSHGFLPVGGPTGARHTDGTGTEFVEIGPGYFLRGTHRFCSEGNGLGQICSLFGLPWGEQPDHRFEIGPVAWVEVTHPFWIAVTEVTNAQYEVFDPDHDRAMGGENAAAAFVSFEEALAFCRWLSDREPGSYRLPTESEWEYTARAGTRTEYWFGDDPARLGDHAWYRENSDWRAQPVGGKPPSPWGLFDVHGNVAEWCDPVDPYRYEWMEWNGRPFSKAERAGLEEEWLTRREAELAAVRFVDENGEPIEERSWLSPDGPRLHPSTRGGGWMSEAGDCGSSPGFSERGGPAGIRLVWIED